MDEATTERLKTAAEWLEHCRDEGWPESGAPLLMVSYTGHDRRWVDEVHEYIGDGLRDVRDAVSGEPFSIWDYADSGSGTRLGGHFPTEIARQMWTCQCAIIIYSQKYLGSKWCRDIELPFLLWRRKHHGIDLFIIRVGETTQDGKPWSFPGENGKSDSIKLEELVDDRNPALLAASKDFSGEFIDDLEGPRLNRRLTALANGIERQVQERQQRRAAAIAEAKRQAEAARKKAEAEAEAARKTAEAEAEAARRKAEAEAEAARRESEAEALAARKKAIAEETEARLRTEREREEQARRTAEAEAERKAAAMRARFAAADAARAAEAEEKATPASETERDDRPVEAATETPDVAASMATPASGDSEDDPAPPGNVKLSMLQRHGGKIALSGIAVCFAGLVMIGALKQNDDRPGSTGWSGGTAETSTAQPARPLFRSGLPELNRFAGCDEEHNIKVFSDRHTSFNIAYTNQGTRNLSISVANWEDRNSIDIGIQDINTFGGLFDFSFGTLPPKTTRNIMWLKNVIKVNALPSNRSFDAAVRVDLKFSWLNTQGQPQSSFNMRYCLYFEIIQ